MNHCRLKHENDNINDNCDYDCDDGFRKLDLKYAPELYWAVLEGSLSAGYRTCSDVDTDQLYSGLLFHLRVTKYAE